MPEQDKTFIKIFKKIKTSKRKIFAILIYFFLIQD